MQVLRAVEALDLVPANRNAAGQIVAAGALAAGSTHHFVVSDFGGYTRAQLAYVVVSGTPTVTAYLTEVIEGPVTVGD